ncbi:hypothetical protein [Flavobacterium sp.]|uniref:hypothetical protein n=1 Tax=Flavobacterium sp. TaxID=239 RepID=UPI0026133F64|nr:hypothetical protein [Flavobacterium sp.]
MAQHKLENDFRDKLNQREIAPSANAWDRLDAMLTVAEKPKKNYGGMYIAASILGFLFIGIAFLSQTDEMTDVGRGDNTVTVKEDNQATDTLKGIGTNETNSSPVKTDTGVAEENQSSIKTNHQNQQSQSSSIKKTITNEALPVIEKSISTQVAERQKAPEPVINQSPAPVTKKGVEVNVDELLASVSIKKQNPTNAAAVQVNPNSLLSQVDGEITLTFRERVINSVNKNYRSVKVALTNRNKE